MVDYDGIRPKISVCMRVEKKVSCLNKPGRDRPISNSTESATPFVIDSVLSRVAAFFVVMVTLWEAVQKKVASLGRKKPII